MILLSDYEALKAEYDELNGFCDHVENNLRGKHIQRPWHHWSQYEEEIERFEAELAKSRAEYERVHETLYRREAELAAAKETIARQAKDPHEVLEDDSWCAVKIKTLQEELAAAKEELKRARESGLIEGWLQPRSEKK